jgi:hypothetical protein
MPILRITLLCVMCLAFAGCAKKSDGKVSLTGKVTLDGEPIPEGSITFMPVSAVGTTNGTEISNGYFSVRVNPGEQAVQIYANRPDLKHPVTKELKERGVEENLEQYIPAKYNRQSTLRVTVDKDTKEHNFELTSK